MGSEMLQSLILVTMQKPFKTTILRSVCYVSCETFTERTYHWRGFTPRQCITPAYIVNFPAMHRAFNVNAIHPNPLLSISVYA
jgi:hypothetical protein